MPGAVSTPVPGHAQATGSTGVRPPSPRYPLFKLAIMPQVRAQLELDLGIFEWHHTFGPFRFDGLAITQGFELDARPGTRASQSFIM